MTYSVATTTGVDTANGLQEVTTIVCDNLNMSRMVFSTYESAEAYAQGYALALRIPFVKPGTEAEKFSTLKIGETFVRVVAG